MSPPIPTPPATTNAPVILDVALVVVVMFTLGNVKIPVLLT